MTELVYVSFGDYQLRYDTKSYLDESSTSPLHRLNQEGIPPESTSPFMVSVRMPRTKPDDRNCRNDRDENDDEMKQSKASRYGLDDPSVEELPDAFSDLF